MPHDSRASIAPPSPGSDANDFFGGTRAQLSYDAMPNAHWNDRSESGLRTYGLPLLDEMLTDSLLIDLGYVDADALSRARDHAERTPAVPDLLCDTLALEVGLRSLA